jgi:hypothetical protein
MAIMSWPAWHGKDEAEANAWLMHFLVRCNGMQHRSESHSCLDDWLQHLPPSGVRAICSWERFCTFAREPERRKVGIDARVSVAGVHYEVDPDLAGETVVLWWGLFDNELYVEHGERRLGPYAPIGGPIPLHRYRAFKKTPTQRRAERIEALAVQLALPRAALEGHPHACAFEQATDVPAIPFADPDPFQEFTYPTVLMAKRAIADELGLPLAKLSSAQRTQIEAILATTLKKTEVMAQIRAHIHAATEGGTPC